MVLEHPQAILKLLQGSSLAGPLPAKAGAGGPPKSAPERGPKMMKCMIGETQLGIFSDASGGLVITQARS